MASQIFISSLLTQLEQYHVFISTELGQFWFLHSKTVKQKKMSETLCLQWNNFKENAVNAFGRLREDKDFTDVTLVCEDGRQLEVHKVVLAISSPVLENILRKHKLAMPLIYFRGVKSEDLAAVVDFLYCGEANVSQENLDSFLALAEEFQLKGLLPTRRKGAEDVVVKKEEASETPKTPGMISSVQDESTISPSQSKFRKKKARTADKNGVSTEVGSTSHPSSVDFKELDERCLEMMEVTSGRNARGQRLHRCTVCGKEEIIGAIKSHIETNHLQDVAVPCNQCEKTFRSRNSLAKHNNIIHNHM